MTSFIAFIITLGVLVFFHELGHFLAARLCGVGVEIFSLGFGPRLAGKKIGLTDYRISAIPLGGFVKMVGEEPGADIAPEDIPISFTHKHVFKRILIVAAGPLFNFLLAVIIFFGIFMVSGTFILKPIVGAVQEGSPAYKAGIQKDDHITAINDKKIDTWNEMAEIITKCNGNSLQVSIVRQGAVFVADVVPEINVIKNLFGEDTSRYVIGITSSGDYISKKLNIFEAFAQSIIRTYEVTELTILSIVKLFQGIVSTDTLGGPIMIAQMAGEQAKEGTANFVFFIALLSVNLAILNFLPIPVLDGGHLLFFFIEALTGSPVNTRVREIAQQAGMFVLLLLMIFVFYNDISRIFSS
ncbi:Zinc metallopeptidase, M50 family [Desulfonema limicola]|uniref:Zinc metalloprotease n=1 Tax=Desulfonema limicola TaxID=45656 RepID=A0A975GIL2_9BACT|nr:Zinc metallopeptidase, M50 family [Desulfonema limicola]